MSKPWGNIGAWAADSEREEAEEREQAASEAAAAAASGGDSQSFPSLKEAVNTKQKKKKMSLQEFAMQATVGPSGRSGSDYKGLTPDDMLRLPTGPKERSAEELQYGRVGGGFPSYGRSSGQQGRMRDRNGDGDTSWGGNRRSYGGFDDDRRAPPPRASDFDQPSRADEVDNWAMAKTSLPSFDSGRPNRYGSLGGSIGGGGMSRADDVDNWTAGKKPIPARSSTFGSSFRDSGADPDRWSGGGFSEENRERPRLVLDPRGGEGTIAEPEKTNKPNPFGAARPREQVLAEKGLDYKKLDLEIETKIGRPTSSQSSRPSSAQSSRSEGPSLQGVEGAVKPRPKVNPFGDAKPREVLLEEKGMNWRKLDLELEHRGVDRPETEAEKSLKEEIDHLKKGKKCFRPETEVEKNLKEEIDHLKKDLEKECALNATRESVQGSGEDQSSLHDLILQKERDLELLTRELDGKVRFGQKVIERPGSGAGRIVGLPERPPSRSGTFEESRSMEFMERPHSRGTGDVWTRQGDDRRSFQGGRERGFLGNRDIDRSKSRDRW